MTAKPTRLGLVGFGNLGRSIYERITADPALGLELAFVWNRSADKLAGVPADLRLTSLDEAAARNPNLIVEVAHPGITRDHGVSFLEHADYLPLSVSALVDDALYDTLLKSAAANGTRLLIPHGALMGVDNLRESREIWRAVSVTFEKHPAAIDFSESGIDGAAITERSTVFEGSAREIGALFPRNVNTMVTCGLATVGLDACRARLIADPALDVGIAIVEAQGTDGSSLTMRKAQPMAGVSGTEMFASIFGSILRAAGGNHPVDFV
jgi:predicted dinucleotide-utilizing enzyme